VTHQVRNQFQKVEEEEMEESEEEDEEESDDEGQTPLRKQLKDHTFEELEALKQKMGLREFNEAMFGSQKKVKKAEEAPGLSGGKKKAKKGIKKKDRPVEVSSKRRVPKFREVVPIPKIVKRDPRFDKNCGEFSDQYWNTDYGFLRDLQKKEAEEYKKKLKTVDDEGKQQELKKFIQRVNDKEKALAAKEKESKRQKQDKEENRKRVAEGKKPFYMKDSTKKLVELAEKYDELKASGGLDKYLKKKRKRNAVRDRKTLK